MHQPVPVRPDDASRLRLQAALALGSSTSVLAVLVLLGR